MKVTAFVGSARKKHTFEATEKFLMKLKSFGDVEYEIISLNEYNLGICKGCKLCLDRGEELCPMKDDRDVLIEKMLSSDGVVFASPNYSFQVSGMMKVFLDRLGFVFHRPRFFGKAFTSIVAQGVYGGKDIVKYFNFIGKALGFNVVKGFCITTREPIPEKRKLSIEKAIDRQAKKFYSELVRKAQPSPPLFDLFIFRWSRTNIRKVLDEKWRDYNYYREQGWFTSDFFYPVKLNIFKKLIGSLADRMAERMIKTGKIETY